MSSPYDPDEIAGIVELFGALTRSELAEALSELAFRSGLDADDSAFDDTVAEAIDAFELIVVEAEAIDSTTPTDKSSAETTAFLAPGPAAFPVLPDGAEDLPHILDVEKRHLDRETLGRIAEQRLRTEAAQAVQADEDDRLRELFDVSYDLEAWAPIDLADLRTQLDSAEGTK
ncbi:MAG: hypothetical protein PPP58_08265 [Natronomonas sp.]